MTCSLRLNNFDPVDQWSPTFLYQELVYKINKRNDSAYKKCTIVLFVLQYEGAAI